MVRPSRVPQRIERTSTKQRWYDEYVTKNLDIVISQSRIISMRHIPTFQGKMLKRESSGRIDSSNSEKDEPRGSLTGPR
jgi:hypothetical protein